MKSLLFLLLFLPVFARAQTITTVAGNGAAANTGDGGPASDASINAPAFNVIDRYGNMYVSTVDRGFSVRKISATGIITTVAGSAGGLSGFSGDGGPATNALFGGPGSIAVDTAGNIYVCDVFNSRVRKITVSTGVVTTIAGNDTTGYSGDGNPAVHASLNRANGICVDRRGNIFICDQSNNRVRKIDAAGIITTVAGTGVSGYNGDGRADTTEISDPFSACSDPFGNVYFCDAGNSMLRMLDTLGFIHTIAGTGASGNSGDGGPATAAALTPLGVAMDLQSNIYISSSSITANFVRMIDTSGIITTLAGALASGFSGDGGPADSARLNWPLGLATDPCGYLYICDYNNYRIRKVTFPACIDVAVPVQPGKLELSVYPNPATTQITVSSSENINSVAITNLLGQIAYLQTAPANCQLIHLDVAALPSGIYLVKVNGSSAGAEPVVVRKFVKE